MRLISILGGVVFAHNKIVIFLIKIDFNVYSIMVFFRLQNIRTVFFSWKRFFIESEVTDKHFNAHTKILQPKISGI